MPYGIPVAIWTTIRVRLANVVLALAALAFVLIPAADAAACAPEPLIAAAHLQADASTSALADADQAPNSGGDHKGEACAHGHCHHQGQVVAPPFGKPTTVWPPSATKRLFVADRAPPGAEPTLLQRPPRA